MVNRVVSWLLRNSTSVGGFRTADSAVVEIANPNEFEAENGGDSLLPVYYWRRRYCQVSHPGLVRGLELIPLEKRQKNTQNRHLLKAPDLNAGTDHSEVCFWLCELSRCGRIVKNSVRKQYQKTVSEKMRNTKIRWWLKTRQCDKTRQRCLKSPQIWKFGENPWH